MLGKFAKDVEGEGKGLSREEERQHLVFGLEKNTHCNRNAREEIILLYLKLFRGLKGVMTSFFYSFSYLFLNDKLILS